MPTNAEADLLQRAQAGDTAAGEVLYRDYFESNKQVNNLLLREVASPEDREDILHDACLSLLRSKTEFRGEASLHTFVYRVVQVAILQKLRSDRARRQSKMVRLFVDLQDETRERQLAVEDFGFERVEADQMAERMYQLLPEPLRSALRLRVNDDLSYAEIARRQEVPVNTAATRIFKARTLLYRLFGGRQRSEAQGAENFPGIAKKSEGQGN